MISGENIKTINNQSILGNGNIEIPSEDTSNHAALSNLDFAHAGHTGFQQKIDNSHKLSSDLVNDVDSVNKFVTTIEKNAWNNKSNFSGSYNDLTDKPTIPTVNVNDVEVNGTSVVTDGVANILIKKDFELLHNVTLTEELAINSFYEISFNDCEEILLYIAFPDTLSTKTTLAYSCDGGTTRRIVMNNQSLEGLEIYSQINAENGFAYSMSGRRNTAPFKFVYLEDAGSYLNYFRILNTATSANAFPIGTVIKLFGRRKR